MPEDTAPLSPGILPGLRFVERGRGRYDFYDTTTDERVGSAEPVAGGLHWSGLDGAGGQADTVNAAAAALAEHIADRYRDHTSHDVVLAGWAGDTQAITVTCRTCFPHVELLDVDDGAIPVPFKVIAAAVRGQAGRTADA